MIVWQTPSFDELSMNAEIGAYQPEPGDDEGGDPPFVVATREPPAPGPVTAVNGG